MPLACSALLCSALLCSALLGILLVACGAPPVYVIVPAAPPAAEHAPQAAPAPPNGVPAEPAPTPQAAPAPRVAPAPAVPLPVVPPGRPGGAPPGADLVELPGGQQIELSDWLSDMNSNCEAAHYRKDCLNLHINYSTQRESPQDCIVDHQRPAMGTEVTTRAQITLDVSCKQPEKNAKQPDGSSGTDTMDKATTKVHQGT